MCYRPLRISNPSRFYHSDQPKTITVPCGYCEDCRRVKQNEWFFRAYMEYMDSVSNGGAVYFPTLTYDDEHLPSVLLPDENDNVLKVGCFCSEDIRSMMRKLRVYLQRDGYEYKNIKFIVCSEFGEKKGRPHYHMLLFIPFQLKKDIHEETAYVLDLLRRSWVNGFVGEPRFGLRLTDIRGVRYAMKYVTKDINFYDLRYVYDVTCDKPIRTSFSFREYLSVDDDSLKRYRKELCKGVMPFHRQSLGFGLSFLELIHEKCLNDDELVQFLVNDQWRLCDGEHGIFPIPQYYHRKIERIIDKQVLELTHKVKYSFTEVGAKVKIGKLYENILRSVKDIKGLNDEFIKTQLPENVPLGVPVSKTRAYFEDRAEILADLLPFLKKVDVYDLALYKNLMRYVPASEDETALSAFISASQVVDRLVNSPFFDVDVATIYGIPDGVELATPLKYHHNLKYQLTYADIPSFEIYEKIVRMLDTLSMYVNMQKNYKMRVANQKKKENKQKYVKFTSHPSIKDDKEVPRPDKANRGCSNPNIVRN